AIDGFLANLRDELDGSALYNALADAEENPKLAEVYRKIAAVERRHAGIWRKRLEDAGVPVPECKTSWRTRTLIWLARRLGVSAVLPTVLSLENSDIHDYSQETDPEAANMAADESSHARMIKLITQTTRGGIEGGALARFEGRDRAGGNALRAAVLGA